ncbi:uncharacterized protein LOC144096767 [Amblyomma americanum]
MALAEQTSHLESADSSSEDCVSPRMGFNSRIVQLPIEIKADIKQLKENHAAALQLRLGEELVPLSSMRDVEDLEESLGGADRRALLLLLSGGCLMRMWPASTSIFQAFLCGARDRDGSQKARMNLTRALHPYH